MKYLIGLGVAILVIAAAYFFGPRAKFDPILSPEVELWDISLDSLDRYVRAKDQDLPNLKPDNESRIVWADSIRKTPYSVVYLHGFTASPMESHPTHVEFAKRLGCNLYIPLLAGHGLEDEDSFLELTPNELIASAKEAVAIGQLLGENVIVMSCSTGSTLAIYLAGANVEIIDALLMYSPNIALFDRSARMLTGPWGEQILKKMLGDYRKPAKEPEGPAKQYWTTTYRTEGLIALQALLDETMTPEVFERVEQPYFVGFYYRDEENQDKTISIDAIRAFDRYTATPADHKKLMAFPDAGEHVIANPVKSKNVEAVLEASLEFAEEMLEVNVVTE
ncbi:alpha/beta hydrolase [Marinoscillum furvescens]|uniref:Esterase/lipase n=1 Tax=Marinoscillum furvescens DSM 4134 TaxID=1122208 RepID=A0A3D9KZ85_MARFU|nr:alpha/beta fold hydrolase [Marinoscillum furvescens]RED92055.1 esterase/lipase [Marinoscillum furvescens DSM 4134]